MCAGAFSPRSRGDKRGVRLVRRHEKTSIIVHCLFIGCILLTAVWISVAGADTLQAPDTTVLKEQLLLWPDSTLTLPDSLPQSTGLAERWLIPLGVILVSGAVAVALFA
jgi:hypothetical protein